MDLYSLTLGLSMAAVGLSFVAAGSFWAAERAHRADAWPQLPRLARYSALASLLLVVFSLVFHLVTGHSPGSAESMAVPAFILEHPSFSVVALLALLLLWRSRRWTLQADSLRLPPGSASGNGI